MGSRAESHAFLILLDSDAANDILNIFLFPEVMVNDWAFVNEIMMKKAFQLNKKKLIYKIYIEKIKMYLSAVCLNYCSLFFLIICVNLFYVFPGGCVLHY